VAHAPHPLAKRIHDRVLQLVGTAMMKAEMAEQLELLGRHSEVPATLNELRAALDETVVELRSIMAELRTLPTADESLKNQAA
jgi:signal transduction histidine kinase